MSSCCQALRAQYAVRMLHATHPALRAAAVLAATSGLVVVGCSTSASSGSNTVASGSQSAGAGAGGGALESGGGGAGGAPLATGGAGGSGTAACVFPTPEGAEADAGAPAQSWCDAAVANPASCPPNKPSPGSACPTAGLQCAYDRSPGGLTLDTCGEYWAERVRYCMDTCEPSDAATEAPAVPACGALPDAECAGGPTATDQERADRTLRQIADCCYAHTESTLTAWLSDGCVSAMAGPPDLVACMNGLLAGRRLSCAKTLSCVRTEWSTLP